MDKLADAVQRGCSHADSGFRRLNLEIEGNTDAFLHAHIWPRCDWEPFERIKRPVALYATLCWSDPANALGPKRDALRAAITRHRNDG